MDTLRNGTQSLGLIARVHLDWLIVPAATAVTLFLVSGLLHL